MKSYVYVAITATLLWWWFVFEVGTTLESVGLSRSRVGSMMLPLTLLGLLVILAWVRGKA